MPCRTFPVVVTHSKTVVITVRRIIASFVPSGPFRSVTIICPGTIGGTETPRLNSKYVHAAVYNFVFTDTSYMVMYTAFHPCHSVDSTMSPWCNSDIVLGIRTVNAHDGTTQPDGQAIPDTAEGPRS
jgi:hypothetical protein